MCRGMLHIVWYLARLRTPQQDVGQEEHEDDDGLPDEHMYFSLTSCIVGSLRLLMSDSSAAA